MTVINDLISEIDQLEPMPAVANQIMKCLEDSQSSMKEIADIIKFDPMLTANVLKLSNSSYYSLSRRVDSVQDAIALLGLNEVVNIVLLKSAAPNLKRKQNGYGLDKGELWRCSVASAILAEALAKEKAPENQHVVFTAALIKDIGKVVLDGLVENSIQKIQTLVSEKGFSFRAAEKKVIGMDHAELGGIIAKKWQFSPAMIRIIKDHHIIDPEKADVNTSIVYLADNICMMMGVGVGHDGLAYRFHKTILKKLDVTPLGLEKIIVGFGENMRNVEAMLDVE